MIFPIFHALIFKFLFIYLYKNFRRRITSIAISSPCTNMKRKQIIKKEEWWSRMNGNGMVKRMDEREKNGIKHKYTHGTNILL